MMTTGKGKCFACFSADLRGVYVSPRHLGEFQFGPKGCMLKEKDFLHLYTFALYRRRPELLKRLLGHRQSWKRAVRRSGDHFVAEGMPSLKEYYTWLWEDWYPGMPLGNANILFMLCVKFFRFPGCNDANTSVTEKALLNEFLQLGQ